MEAGNRCFDQNVPEEINRKVIDHLADFNLCYSQHAQRNLLNEGLHPRNTTVVGSPLTEVLESMEKHISNSSILEKMGLRKNDYFLVSAHRQENVDLTTRLAELLDSLNRIAEVYGCPILVSTHPRTKARLERLAIKAHELIIFHEPFGFIDYIALQLSAKVVLSDSGSISEESAILGFPAITIRDSMERPEALEAGSIVMAGIESNHILQAIELVESSLRSVSIPEEYRIQDTSTRVINFLFSTIHRHQFWNGLRKLPDPSN
jgi:UDP-N-acetylglucosamine 2-epimerase (non-hydrolysing)